MRFCSSHPFIYREMQSDIPQPLHKSFNYVCHAAPCSAVTYSSNVSGVQLPIRISEGGKEQLGMVFRARQCAVIGELKPFPPPRKDEREQCHMLEENFHFNILIFYIYIHYIYPELRILDCRSGSGKRARPL